MEKSGKGKTLVAGRLLEYTYGVMGKPTIAQKGPFVKEMQPGTYAWCACGLSKNQPLCDGSHRKTEFSPIIFRLDETKKVVFCGCKHTKNPPYCDGTHSKLE